MPKGQPRPVRHLWLLRHGKAASDAPWGGSDRERPLTARGRREATALGIRLAPGRHPFGLEAVRVPELAICSAAVRTRQTADLVTKAMGGRVPVDSYRSLYDATPEVVLRYVREIDDGVKAALVVGHNPTIARTAWELIDEESDEVRSGSASGREPIEGRGFPTCSVAVVALPVSSWADVAPETGSLLGLFSPPF